MSPAATAASAWSTADSSRPAAISRMGSIDDNSSGSSYGYRMSKVALNMAGRSLAIDLRPRMVNFNPQASAPRMRCRTC